MLCFTTGWDKASPSLFRLSQQPGLQIQPQRVRIYGVRHQDQSMCCCFAAAFPQDLHQGQRQLLMDGVLEKRGDFLLLSAGTPKQGENCQLARPTRTSWLPYQLEIPVDFSEVGMPVGKHGGGRRKP